MDRMRAVGGQATWFVRVTAWAGLAAGAGWALVGATIGGPPMWLMGLAFVAVGAGLLVSPRSRAAFRVLCAVGLVLLTVGWFLI